MFILLDFISAYFTINTKTNQKVLDAFDSMYALSYHDTYLRRNF